MPIELLSHRNCADSDATFRLNQIFTPMLKEQGLDWLYRNCYCLNRQYDDRSEAGKILWHGGSFAEALPRFEAYLRQYPRDRSVRREYAITLESGGAE